MSDLHSPPPRGTSSPPPYERAVSSSYWTESHGPLDYTTLTAHHPHNIVEHTCPMHPLIAAAYRNRTKNPLCRLPDDVLVYLMRLLDPVSLECLRRCSRIFLRLFPAACVSDDDFCTTSGPKFPWPTSMLKLQPAEKARFLSIMARDWYCNDCLAARQAPDWQERFRTATQFYMHCDGCHVDHPACLFSLKQRCSPPLSRRCIGHEGRVRLCDHETVSWHEVARAAGAVQTRIARHADGALRWTFVKRCLQTSHVVGCTSRYTPFGPLFMQPICCPRFPALVVGYFNLLGSVTREEPEQEAFGLKLVWSAHLSLTLTEDQYFKPDELSRGLMGLREQGAQYICPQVQPGQISGAGLFDPTRCDHLEYEGARITAWDRPPPVERLPCGQDFKMPFGRVPWHQLWARWCGQAFAHDSVACFADISNPRPGPLQILRTEVWGCQSRQNCVKVAYASAVPLSTNIDKDGLLTEMGVGWYSMLDPDTYHLTDDQEGFGVYWCKAKECKNYYRFSRSRLRLLLQDHRHPCPNRQAGNGT